MPVKRSYTSVPVNVSDGGRLLPDLPIGRIGPANYEEKVNFRRDLGSEVKIEGWDYPAPTETWLGDGLADFDPVNPIEAIAGVRRPNGTYAIVGAGGGKIKAFSYDLNAWQTIGSGYSTVADEGFTRWQILDIAGYAVFNNGRDLPCTWQIGDASVLPIYEFRESGYASARLMVEYVDGVLMFADLLEINDADQDAVMNDPQPYKTIVDSAITTRITFNRAWSNEGNPRDFAATVPGSMSASTSSVLLDWPMASFSVGDEILITGAGSAGGNLTTTITAISGDGLTLTVEDSASTTMTGLDVGKATAFGSIVGYDSIEDDGSAIVQQIVLKTQLVTLKASGHIWQTYYTGDLETPFAKDRVTKEAGSALRFPYAVAVINDDYIVFPGARHFYRWDLGSQSVNEHPMFRGAERELFFSRIVGLGAYDVWVSINACTGETLWAYRWSYEESYYSQYYGSSRALAFAHNEGDEALAEIDAFNFTCAASVQKPLAGWHCDEVEMWFLMGDGDGKVTRWGASNLEVFTRARYGELFEASLTGGLFSFGPDDEGKYLRRFSLNPTNPQASRATQVSIYGAKATNVEPVLLITKTLNDPQFPGVANLHYRWPYYQYRIATDTDEEFKLAGHLWRVSGADTQNIDRLQ